MAGVIAFAALLRLALRRGALRRPILLAWMVVGALPALHVGLAWCGLVTDGYLRLARPWAALLALGATSFVALRYLALALASPRARAQGAWRARLGDLLAPFAAFAAAMAAAGPEIGRPLDRLTVLVAVDRSRSIDLVPNADKRVAQELSVAELGMRDDDRIATIAFAAGASTEDPPRPRSQLPAPQRVALGRDGTDLAAGIRRALAEVPPDSAARVVLVTDGVATRGDTMAAAAAAVAAGVPIDVVPLEQRAVPDIRVVALRAPARADEGEALDLRLVTSSPSPAEVEIRLRRDGELIARADASIAAGEDVLRIREKAPGPGLHRYDVEITAKDPRLDEAAEDNAASAFVRVRGAASALVLEGDAGQGAFIARALEDGAFRVAEGGLDRFPIDLGALAGHDVVVLSDIRASDLSPGQLDALASYVRDLGGGLILMGGDRSMGPGGYARTPIEEVSPVSFDLKQERRRASLAEVIGIDISGSMGATAGAHTKLELANEAAARSAALLGPGDRLGVAHVDTVVNWSVPLGPVADKAAIDKAIRSVGPGGGGIYVDITLEAAYRALDKDAANLKHVLLFADGSDAENTGPCRAMVEAAARRGITTSVVALGHGGDVPELEALSRLGNGRFYLVEDAARLPAVFTQETILAARSAIVEEPFQVALGAPSSITAGVTFGEAPPLGGYVVTIPKSRATVLLSGPEGDPVLAVWSAGLGRAAAFTSDLKGRWGAAWTSWPGAARMIAQAARDVARKAEDPRVRLEADASGGELSVRASVVGDDGRAHSFRRLVVHIAGPDGFARELPLEATGAGSYTATLPLSRPGTYVAVARDELTGEAVGTTGAAMTAGEELRPTGSDLALLGRIAAFTGGKRRDTLAGIFEDRASRRFAYRDAAPGLVLLAAFALLLAVAARRLALPEAVAAWSARAAGWLRAPRWGAATEAAGAGATVGALLSARERGRGRREGAPREGVQEGPGPQEGARGGERGGRGPAWTPPAGTAAQPAWAPPPEGPARPAWAPPPGGSAQPARTTQPAAAAVEQAAARPDQRGAAGAPAAGRSPHGPPAAHEPAPGGRPLTAAEKILARRRGRL
ncbi:VWA domain-containing protein [Sorangium sp. So ce1024]|uniref:VWA domain-containing protein n=1 Tax=Sorangium sp. So ce1024 TaxID=3133327 RepID=UPI003F0C8585